MTISAVSKSRVNYLILSLALLMVCGYWFSQITGSQIQKDAAQNLLTAINLEHRGVMSSDNAPPFKPSMYREPVPVWLTALGVKMIDAFIGPAQAKSYFKGNRARYLKYQNILWIAVLSVGTFWACFILTSSVYASLFAALLLNPGLPMTPSGVFAMQIDTLYNEFLAASLLIFASALLTMSVKYGRLRHAVAAGLLLGLLALTKAATVYVSPILFLLLLCLLALPRRLLPHRFRWQQLIALFLAFSLVLLPWIYRNYTQFGSLQVAERGGIVLYIRAIKNQMTPEEYLGSFYAYAPGPRGLIGRVLGFSKSDLMIGGRLQRLNRNASKDRDLAAEQAGDPDGTISYYRSARAMRVKMRRDLAVRGVPHANVEADKLLRERAVAMISANPIKHFAMTLPFLWRGGFTSFVILSTCLILAVVRKRPELGVFVLHGFGTIMFYAIFSHFIPRYSVSVTPVTIISGVVLLTIIWGFIKKRIGGRLTGSG